jgi:hypothetical protein
VPHLVRRQQAYARVPCQPPPEEREQHRCTHKEIAGEHRGLQVGARGVPHPTTNRTVHSRGKLACRDHASLKQNEPSHSSDLSAPLTAKIKRRAWSLHASATSNSWATGAQGGLR